MPARNFVYFLWLLLPLPLLLGSCQKRGVDSYSLPVYIEDPSLFYALSVYQKQQDAAPLSIHLRRGFNLFFQLGGGELPIGNKNSVSSTKNKEQQKDFDDSMQRLTLGSGLFLSSELNQISGIESYLTRLPLNLSSEFSDSPYLTPLLLYPTIFEIAAAENHLRDLALDSLLVNLAESQLPRLLSRNWLKDQILLRETQVYLQNPNKILLNYLHGSPLQISVASLNLKGLQSEITPELQKFIADYRALLAGKQEQNSSRSPSAKGELRARGVSEDPKTQQILLDTELQNAGKALTFLQKKLHRDKPYRLSYRDITANLAPSSYVNLYFVGQLQKARSKPILQLQLERILWGGIGKYLNKKQRLQAGKLLNWLQSLEGQQAIQQQLPLLDSDSTLGIFRGLSIHPEVNTYFWENLQLDWPERFTIRWQLPEVLFRWRPQLFKQLDFKQEKLFRRQSAASISNTFLLPYLFLPNDEKSERQAVVNSGTLDWSRWLQAGN